MEPISPWTIYWVMQMDSIGEFVKSAAAVMAIPTVVFIVIKIINTVEPHSSREAEIHTLSTRGILLCFPFWIPLVISSCLLPSTKSMCAILTIPMVANNETLQADASEIYTLGMERLKDVLAEGDAEKTE